MFARILTLVALAAALIGATTNVSATSSKRVALVIGNSTYASSPLRNPTNDAVAMAATLRSLGYDVIERTNINQKEMNRAIALFGSRLRNDSTAVFYFAGHGLQVKGRNYLVPVDAEISSEGTIRTESVDFESVLDQFNASGSPLNIAILDACRNNPYENRFRSASAGLAQIEAPKGTLIAYATAPGRTALDGEDRNGLYTQELVRQMRVPGRRIEDVFKAVRVNVSKTSNDNQVPWESSSLIGDFYLIPPKDATKGPRPDTAEEMARQLALWNGIKDSTRPEDFQEFLARHPSSDFAGLATSRIIALRHANESENRQLSGEGGGGDKAFAEDGKAGRSKSGRDLGVDLMLAVGRNDVPSAEALIARGADVNCADCGRGRFAGMTPLMVAAQFGATGPENSMLRLLLRYKAEANARSSDGRTALAYAGLGGINATGGAVDTVIELILAGANPTIAGGSNGYTPIFWWAASAISPRTQPYRATREEVYRDFLSIAKTFHAFGANLDQRDKDGWGALHLASASCNPHGILMMLALGIDRESMTHKLMTPREIVARRIQDTGDSRQCRQALEALDNKELIETWKQIAHGMAPLVAQR